MRFLFLILTCAALAAGEETAYERLSARLSAAYGTRELAAVYASQRGDPAVRRFLLVSMDTILRGRNYPVTIDVEREIGHDLRSAYPLLVLQAIETSGNLKLKGLADALKRCFFEADRIDAGYGSGIRQTVIAALESMDDAGLAPVFLEFVIERKRFWFNGDLTAALRALARHGDASCLPHVKNLKEKIVRFTAHPPAAPEDEYRRAKCAELIDAINAIESRFSKG